MYSGSNAVELFIIVVFVPGWDEMTFSMTVRTEDGALPHLRLDGVPRSAVRDHPGDGIVFLPGVVVEIEAGDGPLAALGTSATLLLAFVCPLS